MVPRKVTSILLTAAVWALVSALCTADMSKTDTTKEDMDKVSESSWTPEPMDLKEASKAEEESTEFFCRHCGAPIAYKHEYLWSPPTSSDMDASKVSGVEEEPQLGPKGRVFTFKNPANVEHRVALFHGVHNVREDTKPQSTDSYFKKYTWQPIYCGCGRQVGWKFVHIDEEPVKNYKSKTTTWSSGVKVIEYHAAEEENKLKSLEGECLTHPMGWWNVQYCHKDEIIQFHRQADGTLDPKWSVGKYSPQVERTSFDNVPRGYYHSYFYTHGQICHETNRGRSTEAQFMCCPNRVTDKKPTILSVDEPSLCKYTVKICVPDLCERPSPSPSPEAKTDMQEKGGHTTYFYAVMWNELLGDTDSRLSWINDLGWATAIHM